MRSMRASETCGPRVGAGHHRPCRDYSGFGLIETTKEIHPVNDVCKSVEYTTVHHVIASPLHRSHARWLRGAVVAKVDHPEFHHHRGTDLLYHHPLIRYDVTPDAAVIAGLAEGALLLRGLPRFEELTLGNERHPVIEHRMET